MRLSQLISRTLRQAPAEAETPSHQLLLRAGLAQQVAAGVYTFLPLGWRAMRKVERIIREEMDAIGGQEVHMPVMQPVELWEESGRLDTYIPPLFITEDSRERRFALGPTHEECVTDLFRQQAQSYRDVPAIIYQIQVKMRNEVRSRGGLIRVREFIMKDAYSFDLDWPDMDKTYDLVFAAYQKIFDRCALPAIAVHADSGPIGGKDSQEFIYVTEIGEDEILLCESCGYAANAEKADHKKLTLPAEQPLAVEEVSTPGIKTIDELAKFLDVPAERTLKAVFYSASGETVFVAIRGDLQVNETKLRNALGGGEPQPMDERAVEAAGIVAGSASPVGLKDGARGNVRIVADDSVRAAHNLVAGANKPDAHLRNVNYERDWQADVVADISLAQEGDDCPQCQDGKLAVRRGIEVGHVFKLGPKYTETMNVSILGPDGEQRTPVMGCYGIGLGRLLGSILQEYHDERGIIWPASIAPFDVHLVALKPDVDEVGDAANRIYDDLRSRGIEVLYDDRDESPGVKFADADLLGMPLRVTVSPRTLEQQSVEIKRRSEEETSLVGLAEAVDHITKTATR
jgi:prolyl-tRNA synthetase